MNKRSFFHTLFSLAKCIKMNKVKIYHWLPAYLQEPCENGERNYHEKKIHSSFTVFLPVHARCFNVCTSRSVGTGYIPG